MKRPISIHRKATATVALACSTALVFAVTVQAQPTHAALSSCKIVITGTAWRIRTTGGSLAGTKYTLAGKGMSCSAARPWVTRFTKQKDTGPIKGPAGFTCRSFSTAASGDKLLYSGVCMHPPHSTPFFEWAPKLPGA